MGDIIFTDKNGVLVTIPNSDDANLRDAAGRDNAQAWIMAYILSKTYISGGSSESIVEGKGTAGVPLGGIVSVQGIANGTPVPSSDAGPSWVSSLGVSGETVTSTNASSTPLVITNAPTTGQKISLDDIEISVDTAMTVTLRTTTGNKVLGKYYMGAASTLQITTRGKKKAPTINQTLEVLTSVPGNISVTANYHSEA